VEKAQEGAHRGATCTVRWAHDGSAVATWGEDGAVKVWSRGGMLRTTLAQAQVAVHGLAWGPDAEQVLFCTGGHLVLKPLQPQARQSQWRAHEGVVLCVDWNPLTGLICSGGEDLRFKVWDAFGRPLFASAPLAHPVTSVAWRPAGDVFAAGSFNEIMLCDKSGWSHSKMRSRHGSLQALAWARDGTRLMGGCGDGAVLFADVDGLALDAEGAEVRLVEPAKLEVSAGASPPEEVDLRDRVVKMALGHGHLVVATASQCCIFQCGGGDFQNVPTLFDLKDPVVLILLGERHFLLVDPFAGVRVFTYEGRQVCSPKFQGLQPEFLTGGLVALADDAVAIVESAGRSKVRLFDVPRGRPLGRDIEHTTEILEVRLNCAGTLEDRRVAFRDRNKDLFLAPAAGTGATVKLATMVDSLAWHAQSNMLAAVADRHFCVWYHPDVVYTDRELTEQTRYLCPDLNLGQSPEITGFSGTRCTLRRDNGARLYCSVPPFPMQLHDLAAGQQWEKAARLCRFARDPSLWACLAVMAIGARELHTTEVAYAALDEIDKVQWVNYVKAIPTEEGRSAEVALFCRRRGDAENILLQAGLVYRAIKMNTRLFQWERALELAVSHKTHVDTVLLHRRRYLEIAGKQETLEAFKKYAGAIEINEEEIRAKVQQEKEKEEQRPGARRYV